MAAIACLPFDVLAYVLYNRKMFKGTSQPNPLSWWLWSFLSILNFVSYLIYSKDFVKTLLALENATSCCITAYLVSKRVKKTEPLKFWEKITALLSIIAGLVWIVFNTAFYANLIIQVAGWVSSMPTIAATWETPRKEPRFPWFLWSAIYVTLFAVIALRIKSWMDLIYPINYFLVHFTIFILAIQKATSSTPGKEGVT